MRIAIPVNEKDIHSVVCLSFGRAPYFLVYDTETKKTIFLENIATEIKVGAGIKAAQFLIDNNIKVIIAPGYGENSAKVLLRAGIKVYKNVNACAEDNIKAYEKDELDFLADIHPAI